MSSFSFWNLLNFFALYFFQTIIVRIINVLSITVRIIIVAIPRWPQFAGLGSLALIRRPPCFQSMTEYIREASATYGTYAKQLNEVSHYRIKRDSITRKVRNKSSWKHASFHALALKTDHIQVTFRHYCSIYVSRVGLETASLSH